MYGVLAGFTTFCIRHQIWVGGEGGGGRQSLTTTRHTRGVNVSTKHAQQSPAVHESGFYISAHDCRYTFEPQSTYIYLEYHSVMSPRRN
jgi:hypothetical protein